MEIDAMKTELKRRKSFINRPWANSLECRRQFEKKVKGDGKELRDDWKEVFLLALTVDTVDLRQESGVDC